MGNKIGSPANPIKSYASFLNCGLLRYTSLGYTIKLSLYMTTCEDITLGVGYVSLASQEIFFITPLI